MHSLSRQTRVARGSGEWLGIVASGERIVVSPGAPGVVSEAGGREIHLARPSVRRRRIAENERHQRDRLPGVLGWQGDENPWDGGLKVPESRVVATVQGATLRDLPGSFDEVQFG
jgi:hypothetical protein